MQGRLNMDERWDRTLLIVEDSPEDLEATLRAWRKTGFEHPIAHCADGEDALDYLHRRGRYAAVGAAPRPALVLLDLNLPGTEGREVLAEIKSNEGLRSIPVVVFTTSGDVRDVDACYRAGANGYVQKPVRIDELVTALQRLEDFWFSAARLPTPEKEGKR
jgi:CheY-like chemotaxis protein